MVWLVCSLGVLLVGSEDAANIWVCFKVSSVHFRRIEASISRISTKKSTSVVSPSSA